LLIVFVIVIICLVFFSANHENPELIWNDDAREKVSQTSQRFKDAYVLKPKKIYFRFRNA